MDKSKSASSGFFKILEKVIRGHPLLYYVARYFVRFTNIFEDDAHGVVLLNFKNKINIIDVGASDGIAAVALGAVSILVMLLLLIMSWLLL